MEEERLERRKKRRKGREFQTYWRKISSERLEAADLELRLHAGKPSVSFISTFN